MLTIDAGLGFVDHLGKVLIILSCYNYLPSNHDSYTHPLVDDILVRGGNHFSGTKSLDIVSTVILGSQKLAEFYRAVVPIYLRDEELPILTTSIVTGISVVDVVRPE